MRIRMNSLAAGPSGVRAAGETLDVPDAEARALIDGGYAVALGERPEKALAPLYETADLPLPEVRVSRGKPSRSKGG